MHRWFSVHFRSKHPNIYLFSVYLDQFYADREEKLLSFLDVDHTGKSSAWSKAQRKKEADYMKTGQRTKFLSECSKKFEKLLKAARCYDMHRYGFL